MAKVAPASGNKTFMFRFAGAELFKIAHLFKPVAIFEQDIMAAFPTK